MFITRKYRALLITALFALIAAMPALAVKNVIVVETEVDKMTGASAEITASEVRLVTAGLRREAVKNLPNDRFSIMTAATVQAQCGAALESCKDENCVIAVGRKIGADYIVRGIISKLRARFALSVEMYDTENGNLVASSDLVSYENIGELVEKGAAVCGEMFRTFVNAYKTTQKTPVAYTVAETANPVTVTMDTGKTLTANFQTSNTTQPQPEPKKYTIIAVANPPNGGTVLLSPNQPYYERGTDIDIRAVQADGYRFTGWSGSLTFTRAGLKGKIDRDLMLTANFQALPEPKQQTDNFQTVNQSYNRHRRRVTTSPQTVDFQTVEKENYVNDDSERASDYQGFTTSERVGTWAINQIIPGMGSFIIMKDAAGGITQLLLFTGGVVCMANGFSVKYGLVRPNAAFYVGIGVWSTCEIYNIARSATYKKKLSVKYSAAEYPGLKWAVLPDKNGDIKAYLSYDVKF